MKNPNLFFTQKAQSAVEYLLMFAAVTIVVFTAVSPHGFFTRAINQSMNISILDGTDHMAHCVCYDKSDGEPCTPICGNGCCEEGESGSCAVDCGGDTYHWQTYGWGPCVPVCGPGTRTQVVHCVKDSDGTIVSDSHCTGVKPLTEDSCSGEDCNYFWQEAGWGACSVVCGDGVQYMTYDCVRGFDGQVVFDSYCSSLPDPAEQSQTCNLGQCCECDYQSVCADGSVPCCGQAGCSQFEHSEIELCTPTGCVNPGNLQTKCTPHAGCCIYSEDACRESPCAWNEKKYIETCGDGTIRDVCFEDNSCVLACKGTEIVEHGELCEDDNWGLTSQQSYHTVDECTGGSKCEILCDTDHNYYADGGLCVCNPPIFTESSYVDTAQAAGGSSSYTSSMYSQPVKFFVKVWTEDLIYTIRFYDADGTVLKSYSGNDWDSDDAIDYFSVSYTAYKVYVYLKEGGNASSTSFGWFITGQFTGCTEDACIPSCEGKACGTDGCGGQCGACSYPDVCDSGTCVCFPRCNDSLACGDDGCGTSCGTCVNPLTCYGGSCITCGSLIDATQCNNTADCYYDSGTNSCRHK